MFSTVFFPHRALLWVLFVFLTAMNFSSCVGRRPSQTAGLVPFTSDGCSLFPDGTFRERDKWCDCCQTHDFAYWQGGSAADRKQADTSLRDCVLELTKDRFLAETLYLGARVGGPPVFPVWYRWGYGWPYGRGYQPLLDVERIEVQEQLAAYAKQHPEGYCVEENKEP